MTQKKLDRFERMVDKVKCGPGPDRYFLRPGHVVTLLRKEHRAVVKMMNGRRKLCEANADIGGYDGVAEGWRARAAECRDLLDLLKKRAT